MTETIIVALITGGLSLLGVIITSNKTTRDVQAKLDTQQAVTDTKLDELTREVREHNNFGDGGADQGNQPPAGRSGADGQPLSIANLKSMRRDTHVSRYNAHADLPASY